MHLINKYVDFNSVVYTLTNNERVISLQDKYIRDNVRTQFKRNYFPSSIRLSFLATLLNIFVYGMNLMSTQMFIGVNDGRVGMEKTINSLHGHFVNVECYSLSTMLYVNYGDFI